MVIPKVVDYEIKRGFRVLQAPKKEAVYNALISGSSCCEVAEMDVYSWNRAEQVYAELYNKHFTVGEIDILIAAFCLEKKCTLVTNNTKDYVNIDGLQVEDWSI